MIVLTIRTDKPQAEIGIYDDDKKLDYTSWQAHRELSKTVHVKIKSLLKAQKLGWEDIEGIVLYKGPGSFTGLRIGFSVGNTLAYANSAPVVSTTGHKWVEDGLKRLKNGQDEKVAAPDYGAPPKTTKPRK